MTRTILETDFILAACDGLFEEFSNQQVVEFVLERIDTMSAQEISDELGWFIELLANAQSPRSIGTWYKGQCHCCLNEAHKKMEKVSCKVTEAKSTIVHDLFSTIGKNPL